MLLGHIVSQAATELSYTKRLSYMKDVTTEKTWSFELAVGDGIGIPIYVLVGFMQTDLFNQQHPNSDTFYRPTIVNAQCLIGSGKFTDDGINRIYANDKYSQAYAEIDSYFRHLAKDKILQPYNTQNVSITSNNYPDDNTGYNLCF